ncbi:MAG: DNA-binding transcriptional LysR family regulator [Flavobacteriales bacterium]|jgi:DNA-binding transcriptional LysR family regulator
MMDWDTIKLFLALYRSGSARAVALSLDTSASTITRKITQLEKGLNVKLFNRSSGGFQLTEHGSELLQVALRMENDAYEIERKLLAKNSIMQGNIRITLPNHLVMSPLMNYFSEFSNKNPKVELEIIPSWDSFDLNRGEADIALRLYYKGGNPPGELIGSKIVDVYCGSYANKHYISTHDLDDRGSASWIGWDDSTPYPDWVVSSTYPHLPAKHKINDPFAQLRAAKAGHGLAMLPCFMCDGEDDLVRLPDNHRWHRFDLWMLSHPDLRDTARFREFRQFIKHKFDHDRALWAGDVNV